VPLDAMAARAATLTPPSHRGEVRELASGVTVIDDAYNANPLAVERALDVLGAETGAGRRVAVLGEMLELGAESAALHARVGRAAARAGVAVLVTVGGDPARALGRGAQDAGLAADAVRHAATSDEAADVVAGLVRPGDLVLVKGSRGVRLERVVDRLVKGAS
jgi:UDP-N-acetylmuramoyl-tripeptide--D-alanyl-D-alanine ligase